MKKAFLLFTTVLIVMLSGCGNSNKKSTTKVTKVFKFGTGDTRIFPIENNVGYTKIFDNNETYQTYISDINSSIEGWSDREIILPALSQNIDFYKDRLLIISTYGYTEFDEDIYELSPSIVKIDLELIPSEIQPLSWHMNLHGYRVDREIKTIHFGTYIIDLNDTAYY